MKRIAFIPLTAFFLSMIFLSPVSAEKPDLIPTISDCNLNCPQLTSRTVTYWSNGYDVVVGFSDLYGMNAPDPIEYKQ